MVETKLSNDDIREINKKLVESLQNYRNIVNYMAGDMPIGCLCLLPKYEKALLDHGCLRIYDLFNCDLTKIKGIGKIGVRHLTASLNQFISMS